MRRRGLLLTISAIICAAILTSAVPVTAGDRFRDVPDKHDYHNAIAWMVRNRITRGCNAPGTPARFCPNRMITRAETATFLTRAFGIRASSTNFFDDDNWSVHQGAINAIAAANIASTHSRTYRPNARVTRGQMAAFLVRATGLSGASAPEYFYDDDRSIFEGNINVLAHYGITMGCGESIYCVNRFVTRGEMAAFLNQAVALGPHPRPNPRIPVLNRAKIRRCPIDFARVTAMRDNFGARRRHGPHNGIDIMAPTGTRLYAAANGTIVVKGWTNLGGGYRLWIKSDDGPGFFYAHMSRYAPGLKRGSRVVAGQLIGYVGNTGDSAASHVHFEHDPRYGQKRQVDPYDFVLSLCR